MTTPLADVPLTPDLLRGAVEVVRTDRGLLPVRLTTHALDRVDDPQLRTSASQPSGVRLSVRTRATVLELDTVPTKRSYAGLPPRPDGRYDLVVDGVVTDSGTVPGGDALVVDLATGATETRRGAAGTLRLAGLPARDKVLEVWLPHDETTELVALRADAPVGPRPPDGRRRWLHHGSSLSQGSGAASPTGAWPAVAALTADVDLVNLGFGGGAMVDPATARVMRDLAADLGADDLVSVALGINVVNTDLMRRRAFAPAVHGFLDTLRDGNPDVPLLVVTPTLCPVHEETPGPLAPDPVAMAEGRASFVATGDPADVARGALTLGVVRDELARVVARRAGDDPHLRLLDGRELYGATDAVRRPLPDGVHPDAETHREMGERFARLVLGPRAGVRGAR